MKHFLRLLFIGSVLFVFLGLFSQNGDQSHSGLSDLDGKEQVVNQSGILSHSQESSSLVPLSAEELAPGQALSDIRKFQEDLYCNQSKSQLELAECLYQDIKYVLLHRTGLYLYNSSSKEILS